mmetsp:Transcript_7696/g.23002  ORF Transcript_7696/g.23002 Transcript_7696/m.23002 type:complete len:302 (+) Transcript_7696:781-1686(+)
MEDIFKKLCKDNRYATTIFTLTSGLVKTSKLSKAEAVYRGILGGLLPSQFFTKDQFGVRGGVEFAFMSTTTNRAVAFQYAKGKGAGTILEIQTGMIDRGAELGWLSLYPHEAELCFPPLTGLEVVGTRVEDGILVLAMRLNLNLSTSTIDEVVGKRKKVVMSMCDNISVEINKSIKSKEWDMLCSQLNDTDSRVKAVIHKHAEKQLSKIKERGAEDFNTDKVLLDEMKKALSVGSGVRLQRAAFLDQAADALPDVPALALATRRLATKWRQDELVEQEVTLKFEMDLRADPSIPSHPSWEP